MPGFLWEHVVVIVATVALAVLCYRARRAAPPSRRDRDWDIGTG